MKISNCKLEAETGLRVNTVILDCEGCWVDLVSTYKDKFRSSVDKIILGDKLITDTGNGLKLVFPRK